ncbi:MAG: hypothetical protein H8D87_09480 [Deltaproteobacteria bacterium]|uniref:hypothetical protein n=1 Tax=Desulfobacula sp. TaxID=2593537 RepID=UPI0019B8C419|nr:hypothetical protein [Candidatus Desulfobacula maris]MBL6994935.1 hypothetical protein [Desulfobacula sp.]
MQQNQKTIYEKCFIGITGIAWVAGLLIAGSDSPYMPWLNGIGLILFLGASILLGKFFNPSHSDARVEIYPGCYQNPGPIKIHGHSLVQTKSTTWGLNQLSRG